MSAQQLQIRPQIQPSVQFYDTKLVNRETPRWLAFAGDLIVPQRKKQIDWLAVGGEETNSPCLQKYGRGFIPRGLSALVEMGADHMPQEQLQNVGGGVWAGMSIDGEEVKSSLPYIPAYPADAITNILNRAQNDAGCNGLSKGIVELKSLIGLKWEACHSVDFQSGILDIIENSFFDGGLQPTLRGLKEQITHGKVASLLPIDLGQFKDEWLLSVDEFNLWGLAKLDEEHTQLKQGVHAQGHVYKYSPVGRLLLAQLEVQPQDQPFAELAAMNASLGRTVKDALERDRPSSGMSMEDVIELGRKLAVAEQKIAELEAARAVKPEEFDLTGERPAHVHHKTWFKMRKDAGLEE